MFWYPVWPGIDRIFGGVGETKQIWLLKLKLSMMDLSGLSALSDFFDGIYASEHPKLNIYSLSSYS